MIVKLIPLLMLFLGLWFAISQIVIPVWYHQKTFPWLRSRFGGGRKFIETEEEMMKANAELENAELELVLKQKYEQLEQLKKEATEKNIAIKTAVQKKKRAPKKKVTQKSTKTQKRQTK